MNSDRPTSAHEVVTADLDFINEQLTREFEQISGHRLVIAGGAGFLGYYLVQAPLHWNKKHPQAAPIHVTVLDNFVRGVPEWLTALEGDSNLREPSHEASGAQS